MAIVEAEIVARPVTETRNGTGDVLIVALISIAHVGASAASFAAGLNVLPRVVEVVAGSGRLLGFGIFLAAGAALGMGASIAAGAFSDRLGRRGPWILGGTALVGAGLVALPMQASLAGVAAAWAAVQIGLSVALIGVAALVPDRVPRERLGRVSALAAVGQVVGAVLGIGVIALPGTPLRSDGLLVAAVAVLLLAPSGFVRSGASLPDHSMPAGMGAGGSGTYRDFWLVWMTRLTVALSNVMVMSYLLYYLADAVRHPDPTRGQFVIVVVASVCFTATAIASGWLSDRFRRRKALVAASMLVLAAAEVVLMTWVSWPGAVAGAVVFGIGYGIYLSIDQALVNDVLPRRARAARDLGVFNIANVVPHIVGPLVAAPLVAGAGFPALYALTAVVTLCGVAFVLPIRGVR